MAMDGLLLEVLTQTVGTQVTAAISAGATSIPIEDPTDFAETGGQVMIDETVYDYLTVDESALTLTLATGLVADVANFDVVFVMVGGQPALDYYAEVDIDGEGTGDTVLVPLLTREARLSWPVQHYDPPLPVTVSSDLQSITAVHGTTARMDPAYLQTGVLHADVQVIVGDPEGKRAVIDGGTSGGDPAAFTAFDSSNHQTVNVDGEDNYMEGTFATAASGPRAEMGPGVLGASPANEVRFSTDHADEVAPSRLSIATASDSGEDYGIAQLEAPGWNAEHSTPVLQLSTGTPTSGRESQAILTADNVVLDGTTLNLEATGAITLDGSTIDSIGGPINATMGSGSVGTGTFRDSVDDRVTALAQGLDATLTALAGVTTAANKLIYATGVDAFSTVDFTALAQSLSAVSTVADYRAAILAKDKRPSVNNQTANYTLAATDEDVIVQMNSSSALTLTLPSDTTAPTLPTNFECRIVRLGTGTVTMSDDGGAVTIESRSSLLGINGRYGVIHAKKRGSNRWHIWGDLA